MRAKRPQTELEGKCEAIAPLARGLVGASDAPRPPLAESLGRLLYLAHLGVILWWLLDRSPRQRATKALVALIRQVLPSAALTLRVRPVRGFVQSADALFQEGLLGEEL